MKNNCRFACETKSSILRFATQTIAKTVSLAAELCILITSVPVMFELNDWLREWGDSEKTLRQQMRLYSRMDQVKFAEGSLQKI